MLGAASGILFGVSDVAIKAISGMVGAHGFAGLLTPVAALVRRRLGRGLLLLGQGPPGRRRGPGDRGHRHGRERGRHRRRVHRVRRPAPGQPGAGGPPVLRVRAGARRRVADAGAGSRCRLGSARTVRSADLPCGPAGGPLIAVAMTAASSRYAGDPPSQAELGPTDARSGPSAASATALRSAQLPWPPPDTVVQNGNDWRDGMASTEEAVRTGQSTLQELAKRHLWMHFTRMSAYDDARGSDHRPRRRMLRLGRARQPLPGRALGAVLREHRPRPRGRRPGRRRPGQGARLLHELVLRASAGDRAGRADRLTRSRRPEPRVLHQWRKRGGRVRLQARAPVPQGHRQPEQDEADRARDRLPRDQPRRAVGDGHHQPAPAVRAADARRPSRAQHQHVPHGARHQRDLVRRVDRREDRVRGARHGRGRDPRARPERGRLLHAPGRLLPARSRDLRRVRRPADLRRGDLRLGPSGRMVRRDQVRTISPT